MSRKSDAKNARRRKRLAARDATWVPAPVFGQIAGGDSDADELDEAIGAVDEWVTGRGWELDTDSATHHIVSWVYPPSAADVDDEDREPVTRIWIAIEEDDDEVVLEFGSVLVGFGTGDDAFVLDPETLPEDIGALEAYRPGAPRPVLN